MFTLGFFTYVGQPLYLNRNVGIYLSSAWNSLERYISKKVLNRFITIYLLERRSTCF